MDFRLTEEHIMLRKMVHDFTEKEIQPTAALRDEAERYDRNIFHKMAALGLTGIQWPETYGGIGADSLCYVLAVEELSRHCASTAVTLSTHTSLVSWPIYTYGTEKQKLNYLTRLATGEALGAFAFSEKVSGSDVTTMETTATKCGESYIVNGRKVRVTNGGVADVYIVFAKTNPSLQNEGITAFIVDKETEGLIVGKKERKLGYRSVPTTEILFEQCRLPKENRIGKEGDGFKIVMEAWNKERVGIAAQSVGIAQGALDAAVNYAKERKQFGKPIAKYQGISFKLASMATEIEAARLLTYKAAWLASNQLDDSKAVAIAKLYAGDVAMRTTVEAVQVFGGYGYTKDYPVERYMREAKMTQMDHEINSIQDSIVAQMLMN